MDAAFLDRDGKRRPFVMGCYGIGVTRIAAAAVEQNHDEKGIVWPPAIAPYEVVLVLAKSDDPAIGSAADALEREFRARGREVVVDDRKDASAGVKFKDAELVGYPVQVTLGKFVAEGKAEVKNRKTGAVELVPLGEVVARAEAAIDAWPGGRALGRS
jgi:prolyl-tRNA synthetase